MPYDKDDILKLAPQYTPEGEEKNARDWVYKRYYSMENSPDRRQASAMWDKYIDQWEAIREPKNKSEWQSNHVVPLTIAVVETVLSEVIDQSPKPIILPRGSEDAPKARIMQKIFEYTWDVSDGDLELYNVLKDAFILGTAIGQEYYWREPRSIINKAGKEEKITDFDDCYMEAVRLWDFFVDEKARGFTGPYQARDCIRRYVMDIDDFNQYFQDKNDPLGNAKYVVAGGDVEYWEKNKPPQGFDTGHDVEVLWYWSRKPQDALYVCANGVLIIKGPNPYRHKQLPFARAVDIKRTHSFYGKGEAEILESIQDEQTTMRQMMIDRNHLDIDKMFFVSPYLNLSDEDLIARPHGAIPVDDVNSAKPIEYGDIPRSVELQLKHLEDDSVIATGINPRAQSLPTTGTATEAAIIKESTLKRIRLKMRLFNKEFLVQIGRMRVANILQYYAEPKLTKIVGEANQKQYENEMADLEARGVIIQSNGEKYLKEYRNIRTDGTEINFDNKGQMQEMPSQGFHFFELKPEFFMPVASGGYDIKFEAGATLPISKSLMKEESLNLYDRLIQLAIPPLAIYDIKKLGDDVIRAYDKNPSDFYAEQEKDKNSRLGQLIDMANLENQQIMRYAATDNQQVKPLIAQGQNPVPPTGYANPAHTQIHVEFTKSEPFQALQPHSAAIDVMIDHISGEIAAQEGRQGMTPNGTMGQMPGATGPGGSPGTITPGMGLKPQSATTQGANKQLLNILPSKIQGGGMVAGGRQAS